MNTCSGVVAVVVLVMVVVQVKSQAAAARDPPSPTNVRRLLGRKKHTLALESHADGRVVMTDPMPLVLAEVVRNLGGDERGPCGVLLYYDLKTVPPEDLDIFRTALDVPVTLVDVSKLKFSLITKTRRRVPLIDLLSNRTDNRCRILVAWSLSTYQRALLVMAEGEPGVLGSRDTLVLPVTDQRLDRFIPRLRRRILVKRREPRGVRGRRDLNLTKFLVEGACEVCERYLLTRLGEWRHPEGWVWGGAMHYGQDLSGGTLTVAYTPSVPNIFLVEGDGVQRLDGIELRLLEYAAKALNFSYRLIGPEDSVGAVNKTWAGKVSEVVSGRADIAVGGLVYTEERASVAEYTILFNNELWGIVCPLSARLPVWPYIMFPFRTESAPSVFILLVMLHVMVYLVGTVMGAQAPQGPRDPWAESVFRVVHVGISMYLRFMACLYFWNIYYCFIKPKYEPPVDTSAALLQSGYNWGVVSGTTVPSILSFSRHDDHRQLVSNAEQLSSINEGFQRLRKESLCLVGVPKRYAFATIAMRHTTKCGEPGLQVSTEDLNSVLGGWILARGSPLTSYINSIILRLQSFGLLDHWRKEMHEFLITRAPRDLPCLNPPPAALTMLDLRLALFLLVGGWGLAVFVFIGEQFAYNFLKMTGAPVEHRDSDIPAQTEAPSNNEEPGSLRGWLADILYPEPSINISAKEAAFRKQLNSILRDIWGFDTR
ncbi:glutamate receptor ionotropic, kainate 2 [Procambarus clarkii]|uniref:glutamate receptor ionotropic, kainate 2 n=1 Tax=Procambarus clarkii TaxID=6728 RepID=UPI0037449A11